MDQERKMNSIPKGKQIPFALHIAPIWCHLPFFCVCMFVRDATCLLYVRMAHSSRSPSSLPLNDTKAESEWRERRCRRSRKVPTRSSFSRKCFVVRFSFQAVYFLFSYVKWAQFVHNGIITSRQNKVKLLYWSRLDLCSMQIVLAPTQNRAQR